MDPGEVVVILGPNGSGKSTLLRLLATDLAPGSGELLLFGEPAAPPTPALRRRIGFAAHEPAHLEPLTGAENARFFLRLLGSEADGRARLHSLLDGFRLMEAASLPVAEYSFGMKRKLLLAQVLAPAPELLLLDEPTIGLDPDAVTFLGAQVRSAARRGSALVLATNEVHRTPQWATRIVFLHRGRVVEDAEPEALRGRLPGDRRIEVRFRGSPGEMAPLSGLEVVRIEPGLLEARSRDPDRVLPTLLSALADAGARIRAVRVHEPDLGDLFHTLTGEPLAADAARSGEQGWQEEA